ncbi:Fic family protein [Janthinobacterium lividum]|uniref:Fic family protein n=1 Tax=Janthinobacterium lividum TaxID=29581 RepID=UPI003D228B1E
MILFEITNTENHPLYQALEVSNGARQYDFLRSIVAIAIGADRRFLSQHIIKALNFQAITCLHTNPGEFRPCPVTVGNGGPGDFIPPQHFQVQALMDDFVNMVNSKWESSDPIGLAAFTLWRLNYIHPFINGNGRTARAACYYVLCVKAGDWLPGETILPELIRQERAAYVHALRAVDRSHLAGTLDLTPLHSFLSILLTRQLESAGIMPPGSAAGLQAAADQAAAEQAAADQAAVDMQAAGPQPNQPVQQADDPNAVVAAPVEPAAPDSAQ